MNRIVDSSGRQRIFHGSNVVCIYLDLRFFENFLDTNLKTSNTSALPPRCTRPARLFQSRRSLMLATVLVRRTRTSWPVWVTIPSGKGKCTLQKTWQLDKYFKKRLGVLWAGLEPTRGEYNMTYMAQVHTWHMTHCKIKFAYQSDCVGKNLTYYRVHYKY